MDITKKEILRPSANGEGNVFSRLWLIERPRAVVQIAHGMSEHSGRYEEFAAALCAAGYAVCANDHLGHGHSMQGYRGSFARKPGGFGFVIEDMHGLYDSACAPFDALPRILIGHSMGSVLSGLYAAKHHDIAALALLGSPAPYPFTRQIIALTNRTVRKNGYGVRAPRWLEKVSGSTAGLSGAALEEKEAWLTRDIEQIRAFIADDLTGFDFTADGFSEFMRGMRAIHARDWGAGVPDIPVLLVAGGSDSAAKYGKGPALLQQNLLRSGHTKVSLKIFPDDRHEILNELDRADVYAYILDWLDGALQNMA